MKNCLRKIFPCILISLFPFLGFSQKLSYKIKSNTIEISNGNLGIVIPSENAFKPGQPCPAPVQSFIYKDGTHSDNSFNELVSPTPATSMKVQLITKSSTLIRVRILYHFQKKEFSYGKLKLKRAGAGKGFYSCEITVAKDEKSIILEEDSDYDIQYSVKISNGLWPNQARYRGWSSASIKQGYETAGKIYRSELERGYPMDATVDIEYSKPFNFPRLVLWEPAGGEYNSGRYWQVFNSNANSQANLFGFFQGKTSRLIGARGVGVQLIIAPEDKTTDEKNNASIRVNIDRIYADLSWYPRKRFQWAAFISTKTDLLAPEKTQPIGIAMNQISGLGNVIESYSTKPAKIVPAFYEAAIYMSGDNISRLCKKVKDDVAFYKELCAIDGSLKPVFDAWRFTDSAKGLIRSLINASELLQVQYRKGEGTYTFKYRYWMGTNLFKSYAFQIACLFADKNIVISASDKKKLEGFIAMMARIVWDDNNVPLIDSAGVNFGPANMAFQYRNNGRFFFALLLANDPEFSDRAHHVLQMIKDDIDEAVYNNGSSFGSPHYIQATLEPLLFSMLQLKNAGMTDLFRSNKKIKDFARFYMTLVTPPSVRFQLNRKLISFGDGSEESAPAFALLGTGFADIDPLLSKQLMTLFFYGPPRSTLFGTISLAVDLSVNPRELLNITTANYTGYMSHYRSGINTDNESALWVLNGNGFYDHRNDDAGEIAIYALKAPLSLSRSSFYYPAATDARIRSVVVPERLFPEWKLSDQPIAERSLTNRTWPLSDNIAFANLGNSATSTSKMEMKDGTIWFRKINWIVTQGQLPVIVFYDSISGKGENIWSMPMMSEGPVNTPAGLINPVKKIYTNNALKQLPEATEVKLLKPGLNRFVFTGQNWSLHPEKGINWDLYTYSKSSIDFTLSDWGTTWQNTKELNEFRKSNKRQYSEEQQILRLRSNRPFFNILLPYGKDQNPYNNSVSSSAAGLIRVKQGDNRDIVISPDYYYIADKEKFSGALFSETAALTFGEISVSGGYTELENNEDTVKVRVHGNTGIRKINLPFLLKPFEKTKEVQVETGTGRSLILINYQPEDNNLHNGEKGYREYIFLRK